LSVTTRPDRSRSGSNAPPAHMTVPTASCSGVWWKPANWSSASDPASQTAAPDSACEGPIMVVPQDRRVSATAGGPGPGPPAVFAVTVSDGGTLAHRPIFHSGRRISAVPALAAGPPAPVAVTRAAVTRAALPAPRPGRAAPAGSAVVVVPAA